MIPGAIPGGDHITAIKIVFRSPKRALFVVDVRLFLQIRTPTYHVVIGEIDLENPRHVAMFNQHRVDCKIGPAFPEAQTRREGTRR